MKTDTIHITETGEGIPEILHAIEDAGLKEGCDSREAAHLRLLMEETLELVGSVTGRMEADFSADIKKDECSIRLTTHPSRITPERARLMSLAADQSGIANKIAVLFESSFDELLENEEAIKEIGIHRVSRKMLKDMGRTGEGFVWTLDSYELSVFDSRSAAKEENWAEISRSIIATLSDEVRIFLFRDSTELVIIKRIEKQAGRKGSYAIHPDFEELKRVPVPKNRFQVRMVQLIYRRLMQREVSGETFTVSQESFASDISPKGDIKALIYSSSKLKDDEAAPCLLWVHGGAFIFPALPYHYRFARLVAEKLPCRVVMPMYHLAPDHVPPLQQEEILNVYSCLLNDPSRYGIDPARIIAAGDSAGGTLAAALCLMAGDRNIRMPLAQALFYPSLDARLQSESMKKYPDVPVCNGDSIMFYCSLCQPEKYYGSNDYRSPLEAASLNGLPDTYIETAEFDALHDDGISYAKRLQEAGIEVTLNETKGTVHAFEMAKNSDITKAAHEKRLEFFKKEFGC